MPLDRYGENPDEPVEAPDREWAAHARAMAIVNCELCDDDGYRGCTVCDHIDYQPIAARGMEKVRDALGAARKAQETQK